MHTCPAWVPVLNLVSLCLSLVTMSVSFYAWWLLRRSRLRMQKTTKDLQGLIEQLRIFQKLPD